MARTVVAADEHTRRAVGWSSHVNSSATQAHVTKTGSAFSGDDDDAARTIREAKWTSRDGYSSQGTDGRTASGSIHFGRD